MSFKLFHYFFHQSVTWVSAVLVNPSTIPAPTPPPTKLFAISGNFAKFYVSTTPSPEGRRLLLQKFLDPPLLTYMFLTRITLHNQKVPFLTRKYSHERFARSGITSAGRGVTSVRGNIQRASTRYTGVWNKDENIVRTVPIAVADPGFSRGGGQLLFRFFSFTMRDDFALNSPKGVSRFRPR